MDDVIKEVMREHGRDSDQEIGELMQADDRDREQLFEDMEHSDGAQLRQEVESLYTTLDIVNKNYQLLTQGRDWYQERGTDIWDVDNRDELDAFQREYLRLLHNYSASVHSLISHTYTLLDRYEEEKPGLKEQYFEELQERELDTEVDLVKQLRHYTQKRELPPLAVSMQGERNEAGNFDTEYKIIIKKEEMMDWDEWKPDVRERLEEWDDEIDVTDLASDFQKELNDFYKWFRRFLLRMFYDEIEQHVVTLARLEEELPDHDQ